ncbi:MAG: protein kinase [Bryobacterales bacterium]|jgi:tetratricopeptide (TPR) repeat protein|nr:protein kinase [Bryobacterales bacterium]
MDAARWKQVEELFHQAINVDDRARTAWLKERCAGDHELLEELTSLLRHEMPAEEEIRHLVAHAAQHLEVPARRKAAPGVGDNVGPYHLIKEIGSGGMGVVFLAMRNDPQFFQTVAIKILRREFDASILASRFLRERQILATLSHPNIARVLDGGSTEDGTPYLVMEFISGKPITAYAAEKQLGIEEKIRLFQKVCEAVQHAHRSLVIHRDLKPGNVMVGDNGEPKLLDFGIAKLLGPELLPMELPPTETQWRLMTPDYASPEQLRGEPLTTATDVYSLGVLLYELLTGERPLRFKTRDPMEWVESICSREPELPSKCKTLNPRERRLLQGDLDQIVLKALRKEPERRYGSASRLADDLERFLNGEPVEAHRGTVRYRTFRFVHRHRLVFSMGMLVIMALVGGMATTTWQARQAERRFQQLRGFAHAVVFELDDRIRALPGSTEARGALIRTSLRYVDNLSRDAGGDAELMAELARAYRRIGDVQGSPFQPNLGDTAAAIVSYRKAVQLGLGAQEAAPRNLDVLLETPESQFALGRILAHSGGLREASELFQEATRRAEQLARDHSYDARVTDLRSRGAMYLGDVRMLTGEPEKAMEHYRLATLLLEAADATDPSTMREIARAYARLADARAATGNLRLAVQQYERSIELRRTLARRFPQDDEHQRDLFNAYISLGSLWGAPRALSLRDKAMARQWFAKALVIAEDLAGNDPASTRARVDVAFARAHMAESLPEAQLEDAIRMMRDSVQIFDDIVAASPKNVGYRQWQARRYDGLAQLLRQRREDREALSAWERALAIRRLLLEEEPSRMDLQLELSAAACGMVGLLARLGDPRLEEAAAEAQRLLVPLENGPRTLGALTQCAECYEALALAAQRLGHGDPAVWRSKAASAWETWRERGVANPYTLARLRALQTNPTRIAARRD